MNLSLSLKQSYKLEQKLVMKSRYVTSGDLELLSLHRIKNRIHSLDIESPLKSKLIGELIRENREYRRISKNKWNCITPISLDVAVDNTYNFLKDQVKLGVETIDDIQVKSVLNKFLFNKAKEQNGNIKKWFSNNYDKILYDMNGKIPYPIIMQMRAQLSQWALGNTSVLYQPINDLIKNVAKSEGLNPDDYFSLEDVWEALKK
jgi:flagellar biosynthesis/type III secretory pathway chaperone